MFVDDLQELPVVFVGLENLDSAGQASLVDFEQVPDVRVSAHCSE